MAAGRVRADLDSDRQFNLAMTRLMELVGEAASHISDEFRVQHPQVPWSQVVAFRNRLIHGYDRVDFDVLWEIIRHDLPALIRKLEVILGD